MELDVSGESSTPEPIEAAAPVAPAEPSEQALADAMKAGDQGRVKAIRLARRSGKPVPVPVVSHTAEATAAEPAEQVASTDASPKVASEPTKPAKHNAETRIRDLVAENKRLASELEGLRKPAPDVKPAESSPAKPKTDAERYISLPNAPKIDDFEDITHWAAAVAVHIADQREIEREQKQQAEKMGQTVTSMTSRGAKAFKDFDEVLTAADREGLVWPEPITQLVLTHERGHEIAYILAKERIADPVKAGMRIAALLADKQTVTVPKTTQAPAPPHVLSTRSSDVDQEMSVVRDHDQESFKALRLAKRIAARGSNG